MGLLADMTPDLTWAKRGGTTDRDGTVLTVRRAAVLNGTLGVRGAILMAMIFWIVVCLIGTTVHVVTIVVLISVCQICDAPRMAGVSSSKRQTLAPVHDLSRIAVVLAFVAPPFVSIVLWILSKLFPEAWLFSLLATGLRSIGFLLVFGVAFPCAMAYDSWLKRAAALSSTAPEMVMVFVPDNAKRRTEMSAT